MSGILYLVGTPIGNLGDITKRAADTLAAADFIAAEDTRVSLKLLNHLGLKKSIVSYYEHNRADRRPRLRASLPAGAPRAPVTDAGMPAISDPGEDLVRLCAEAGITVCPIPGPSAVVTALAVSGLPTGRFTFEGFLSTAKKSRFEHLSELKTERRTMLFYEAPHKLLATLQDLLDTLGDRRIAVCRELTKLHEEILRTTLSGALAHFSATPPRGEFVLVIEGAEILEAPKATLEDALEITAGLRAEGLSLKDAVRQAADQTGIAKNVLYGAALKAE